MYQQGHTRAKKKNISHVNNLEETGIVQGCLDIAHLIDGPRETFELSCGCHVIGLEELGHCRLGGSGFAEVGSRLRPVFDESAPRCRSVGAPQLPERLVSVPQRRRFKAAQV